MVLFSSDSIDLKIIVVKRSVRGAKVGWRTCSESRFVGWAVFSDMFYEDGVHGLVEGDLVEAQPSVPSACQHLHKTHHKLRRFSSGLRSKTPPEGYSVFLFYDSSMHKTEIEHPRVQFPNAPLGIHVYSFGIEESTFFPRFQNHFPATIRRCATSHTHKHWRKLPRIRIKIRVFSRKSEIQYAACSPAKRIEFFTGPSTLQSQEIKAKSHQAKCFQPFIRKRLKKCLDADFPALNTKIGRKTNRKE